MGSGRISIKREFCIVTKAVVLRDGSENWKSFEKVMLNE